MPSQYDYLPPELVAPLEADLKELVQRHVTKLGDRHRGECRWSEHAIQCQIKLTLAGWLGLLDRETENTAHLCTCNVVYFGKTARPVPDARNQELPIKLDDPLDDLARKIQDLCVATVPVLVMVDRVKRERAGVQSTVKATPPQGDDRKRWIEDAANQVADAVVNAIYSRAEAKLIAAEDIPLGSVVAHATTKGRCKLPLTSQDVKEIIGISTYKEPLPEITVGRIHYEKGTEVLIVTNGNVWVRVEESVNAGDPVYVRFRAKKPDQVRGGVRRSRSHGAGYAPNLRFASAAEKGKLAIVEVRGEKKARR